MTVTCNLIFKSDSHLLSGFKHILRIRHHGDYFGQPFFLLNAAVMQCLSLVSCLSPRIAIRPRDDALCP